MTIILLAVAIAAHIVLPLLERGPPRTIENLSETLTNLSQV